MRILLVTPYFAPAWSYGGIVKVVFDLAKRFHAAGHEVTVATTDVLDKHRRVGKHSDILDGVRVLYFRNVSNRLAFHVNGYFPYAFGGWCKKNIHTFDIVHCHDAFTWLNIVVARQAARTGVPFILQPHGAINQERVRGQRSFAKAIFFRFFANVFSTAATIVVSTDLEKEEKIFRKNKKLLTKTVVIPNGLPESQISMHRKDNAFRSQIGVGEREICILYFGRLHPIKGVDISLSALALCQDVPWKYIIVGRDDGILAQLQAQAAALGIADRVVFQGPTFGHNMQTYLNNADVFLFNSRSEGLPMSVLDACAAGLPCILSSGCNVPEVAVYGAGIVLKDNSPEETAGSIRIFFQSPTKQEHMQAQAHQLIREHFNLERIVQRYVALYASLVPTTIHTYAS